jgi:hypothetical protein
MTIRAPLLTVLFVGASSLSPAQEPAPPPVAIDAAKAEARRLDDLIAAMRAAEAKLTSVSLRMATMARLPGGLAMSVRGELRARYGEGRATYAKFRYETGDGLRGSVESAQTAAGITLREDDPAFGEVYVVVEPALVADLEWAGRVLQRDDLPGMPEKGSSPERRAASPLGSGLLVALRRQFALAVQPRSEHDGQPGTWLAGPRQAGLAADDPDLPVADRVEAFVRTADLALVSMRQYQGEQVVQEVLVEALARDVDMPIEGFAVAAVPGQKPKPVQQFVPLWEAIQQACLAAEAKCEKDAAARNEAKPAGEQQPAEVRPSKR